MNLLQKQNAEHFVFIYKIEHYLSSDYVVCSYIQDL